jgi:DNA-binding NarL/FixJ family response regulator
MICAIRNYLVKRSFTIARNVKVLISSGVAQEDLVKDVVDLGARGSLLKPYGMKTLLEKVREVLDMD